MPPNALRGESQGESFGDQDNPGEQIPTLPKPPAEQTLLSSTSHDTTQDIASTVEPSPALPKQPVEEVLVHQPPNRQANTTIDIIQIARNGEPDDLLEFLEALTPDKWEQVFQIYQERVVQAEKIRDYRFTFSIAWMYCLGLGQPISLPDALKQWSHIARSKTSESTRSEGLRKSAAFLKFWFVALGVTFVENWAAAHEIEVLYKLGELPSGSDMQDYSLLFMWCRFGAERSEL
ncbi:uncharacterized protein BJ171DRAFT_76159 [Polychytrium aggregatum]|uniref:uncharacterized protein n=1 Tax=Polychytrium aggregatum TaxID=110093 RepID=UPI0022FEB075|nr:uncharacterized protein BJ171DRAFT_76159 [Polychytrium aggregatum]KAI9190652.1 hypothetical protein BJ171DRAFT_76159 [Polychytrium aggregatum]